MEAHFGNGLGPPMHDGISVLKHGLEEPELIAEKLSEVVSEALGYKMVVHHEAWSLSNCRTCARIRGRTS